MSTDLLSRAEAVGVAWPLTAERLVLRPFTAEDAEAVWSWWGLHETTDWTGSRYDSAALRRRTPQARLNGGRTAPS